MLRTLSFAFNLATSPLWMPWKAYRSLWWMFDDAPTPTPIPKKAKAAQAGQGPAESPRDGVLRDVASRGESVSQNRAFEVTNSRPTVTMPLPLGPARAGFAATLLAAIMSGGGLAGAAGGGSMTPAYAVFTWVWIVGLSVAGTMFLSRRVAIRRHRAAIARAERNVFLRAGRAVNSSARTFFEAAAAAMPRRASPGSPGVVDSAGSPATPASNASPVMPAVGAPAQDPAAAARSVARPLAALGGLASRGCSLAKPCASRVFHGGCVASRRALNAAGRVLDSIGSQIPDQREPQAAPRSDRAARV